MQFVDGMKMNKNINPLRNGNVQLLHLQVFLQIQCVGSICFDIVQKCILVIVMCSLYITYRILSRTLMQREIFLNREHKIQKTHETQSC